MIRDYRNNRLVDVIINKTDELICMYDQRTGDVRKAYPDKTPFPDHADGIGTCFIVTPDQLRELRFTHPDFPLENIGVLTGPIKHGYHNLPIGKIMWAKDPKIEVLFMSSLLS